MFTQLTLGVHVKDSEDYSLLSNGSILFFLKKKSYDHISVHYNPNTLLLLLLLLLLLKSNVLVNIGTYFFFF